MSLQSHCRKRRKQFSCVVAGSHHSHKPKKGHLLFGWVDTGQLPDTHPAILSLPILYRTGEKREKSWGSIYGPRWSQGCFPQVFPHPCRFCLLSNVLSHGSPSLAVLDPLGPAWSSSRLPPEPPAPGHGCAWRRSWHGDLSKV